MEIHYNGRNIHFIVYTISNLIGTHLSMVKIIYWKWNNSKNKNLLAWNDQQQWNERMIIFDIFDDDCTLLISIQVE